MIKDGKNWLGLLGGAIALFSMSAAANASCANLRGHWAVFGLSGKPTDKNETATGCDVTIANNGDVSGACASYKAGTSSKKTFNLTGNLQASACAVTGTISDGSTTIEIHSMQLNGNVGSGIATNNKEYVFLLSLVRK